jgi:hypothetical protein
MNRCTWALAAAAVLLAACGDRPQTATKRKVDDKPWDSTQTQHMVSGFKAGDRSGWEQQLKTRAQAQNEYNRTTGQR